MCQPQTGKLHPTKPQSESIHRLTLIKQEQQNTYNSFNVQIFYQNNRLNVQSLKDRIQKFKLSKIAWSKDSKNTVISNKINESKNQTEKEKVGLPNRRYIYQQDREGLKSRTNEKTYQLQTPKLGLVSQKESNRVLAKLGNHRENNRTNCKLVNLVSNEEAQSRQQRQQKIKSYFQIYNPQSSNTENKLLNIDRQSQNKSRNKIKRQSTQEKSINTKSSKHNSFKFQPISTTECTGKDQRQLKLLRHSRESKRHNLSQKAKQKSFFISQNQTSRLSYRNFQAHRIQIASQYQLDKIQALIASLWSLYELLSKIMKHAQDFPFKQQKMLQRYIKDVCEQSFEYLSEILQIIQIKRLKKAVISAKILENISVFYLAIQLTKCKEIKQSHIINFIGFCTSNIIFVIKIIYLVHSLGFTQTHSQNCSNSLENVQVLQAISTKNQKPKQFTKSEHETGYLVKQISNKGFLSPQDNRIKPGSFHQYEKKNNEFSYSNRTRTILQIIRKFELSSYKQQITKLLDAIIRMQHNNEIINIVQIKLCNSSYKNVESIVSEFLKSNIRNENEKGRPFFQSARYIFQFLAYHFTKQNIYGHLPALQVAPKSYLNLMFPQTVIIQPYGVLVYSKGQNILMRAHAQAFVLNLSNLCNVVFWSDMLPEQIDPILGIFPKKQNIYCLYRHHCIRKTQTNIFVKPLERISAKAQDVIIIDRSQQNFINYEKVGIQFSWLGQKKDTKLLELFHLLKFIINKKDVTLEAGLTQIRPHIESLAQTNKHKFNTKQMKNQHKFRSIEERTISNETSNEGLNTDGHPMVNQQIQLPALTSKHGHRDSRNKSSNKTYPLKNK